ncbi:Facilitated trehalose transporter Tret1, partial [Blattella germanica]
YRLEEETKPWLDRNGSHKPTIYHVGAVYKPTTEEKPPVWPQIFAAIAVASFHVVVGFSLAFSAILIPQLEAPDSDLKIEPYEAPWLVSVLVLVVPIGALLAGFVMEYVGRLNTIKLAAIPCLLGWFLIATGTSFGAVFCGRFLTGVAAGMVLSYLKGAYLTWRTAAWTSVGYVVVPILLMTIWIPESPVWLVARGRVDEAQRSLKWLAGQRSSLPEQQLAALVKSQDMKALVATGFMGRLSGFLRPSGYKPMFVLMGLFFFQQFSGVYITLFYSVELFKDVGSGLDPYLASILVGLTRLLMSFVNAAMLRLFGRRPLCMLSGIGMAICMVVSGMLGLLSIPWTMTAELFPTEIRGLAHGITLSLAHILMFLAIQSYRDMKEVFGGAHAVQWFFAAMALGAVVFVYIFLPETHGKKLAEIEQYFVENAVYIGQKKPLERTENGAPGGELVMITAKA